MKRQVVHAVVENPIGQVLILRRVPNKVDTLGLWDLPGGGVEEGEHPVNAMLREIYEEVGIHGAIIGYIGTFDHPHYAKPDVILECIHYRAMLVATPDRAYIKLNENEHTECRWVSKSELEDYQFLSAIRENMDKIFT